MPKITNLKYKLIITFILLAFALILYLSPISCVFLTLFNVPCFGCGMTRALLSALSFDFFEAFSYHKMFWSVPLLYLCFLFDGKLFKQNLLNIIFYILIFSGFLFNWFCHFM